jgi:hypothetical protein
MEETREPAGDGAPAEHEPGAPLATPETEFARRIAPPPPEPPLPPGRRAVFFDVENTSEPARTARIIDRLAIDRLDRRTEFVAVGNWRVIGQDTARLLAKHGAQLVHSAPATGVRDWSDLRIAVSAGAWLAAARPGDVLEIVSDDRAFDAVGDVAAALGIAFRRLTSRALAGETAEPAPGPAEARPGAAPRGRRGRRGPGRTPGAGARGAAAAAHPAEGHTTPHDELIEVVRELAAGAADGQVLIDTLERTLKARGFSRPPGSPRLITRLRRIKELAVTPRGMISLVDEPAPRARESAALEEEPVASGEHGGGTGTARRRRSRRGGRRRRRGRSGGAGA